jgi:hypothetical protein
LQAAHYACNAAKSDHVGNVIHKIQAKSEVSRQF